MNSENTAGASLSGAARTYALLTVSINTSPAAGPPPAGTYAGLGPAAAAGRGPTSLQSTAQYFYTITEMQGKGASLVGKNVRASGAVIGSSITYDPKSLTITFEMANVSNDAKVLDAAGGLAEALHQAVLDPNGARIKVNYVGVKPDLLKDEAQAIVTGKLGEDGVFYADELLLKCPTRYEEALPSQAAPVSGN
ncbi:MAG: cytochrome c maturation protein CcmE [Anaerolineales bacterium]